MLFTIVFLAMETKRKRNRAKILVVVHDAGGAETIGAYIQKHLSENDFYIYGSGPAVRIFRRLHLPLRKITDDRQEISSIMQRHKDAKYALLAAPGWMTRIEISALEEAKRVGLKTVVYMDGWVDERKRFGYPRRGWKKRLPDIFWAGDMHEEANMRRQFPNIPIRRVPNQYFTNHIKEYRSMKRAAPSPDAVLFMSQDGTHSDELLKGLLNAFVSQKRYVHLRIRYHPVDSRKRYDAILRMFKEKMRVEKSREKDIVKDLLRARVVVGTETNAMVLAVLCGIRTINVLKKGEHTELPFPAIKRVRSATGAARLISAQEFSRPPSAI